MIATRSSQHPTRLCVIDLGTNSFHAVIVDAYPSGVVQVLDRFKEMVQLGEGGLVRHELTEAAMERGVQALGHVQLLAEGWKVDEYQAFATSAIREAVNGGAFIHRVKNELGLYIRPISGRLEAELIYKGVRQVVDLSEPALLVDIGGGSTEFILGTTREVLFAESFKVGAARLTEQFVQEDPAGSKTLKALRKHLREVLAPVYEAVRQQPVKMVVGSSGTFQNLARVALDRMGKPAASIFEEVIPAREMRKTAAAISGMAYAERQGLAGIDEKRVEQVVAGAVLVALLLRDLKVETVRISPHALREGMVDHYIEQNNKRLSRLAVFDDVRRRSIFDLGYRFRWEEGHARHVADLALQLFDACRSMHGLGPEMRELLEYAALLHDIGYHISRRSHHKHSLYLIQHADLKGFSQDEIDLMAHVARYHRRSMPKKSHTAYMALSPLLRKQVGQLASLLRLAEALDRSHYQNVAGLQTHLEDGVLRLLLETRGDPEMELWAARQDRDLFEETYAIPVVVDAVQVVE